jgi:hypothetical protein
MHYFVRLGRIYLGLEKGPEDPEVTFAGPVETETDETTPVESSTAQETTVEVNGDKNTDSPNAVANRNSVMSGTGQVNITRPPGTFNDPHLRQQEWLLKRMHELNSPEVDDREKSDRRADDTGESRPLCSPDSGRYVNEDPEEAKAWTRVHHIHEVTPSIIDFAIE